MKIKPKARSERSVIYFHASGSTMMWKEMACGTLRSDNWLSYFQHELILFGKIRVATGSIQIQDKRIRESNRFSCLKPGLDWTRLFMSLTAGAGTRCMSLLPDSPSLCASFGEKKTHVPAKDMASGKTKRLSGAWRRASLASGGCIFLFLYSFFPFTFPKISFSNENRWKSGKKVRKRQPQAPLAGAPLAFSFF